MPTLHDIILELLPSIRLPKTTAGFRRLTVSQLLKQFTAETFRLTSANEILRVLKGQGLGVRRQWLLKQVRSFRHSLERMERELEQSYDDMIRTEDMGPSRFELSHDYSYELQMEVQGYTETSPSNKRDIDEWGTQTYYFGSNNLMTPRQVEAAFMSTFRETTMSQVRANWETLRYVDAFKG